MFVDCLSLLLSAGKGGDGVIAWRREKYIPKGGPAGGDGGNGGAIIFQSDSGLFSLDHLHRCKHLKAQRGRNGSSKNQKGNNGEDLVIHVPVGTIVKEIKTSQILFDFTKENQQFIICKGGKGGKGNTHFKTATRQAPYICTSGKEGESKEIELELKYIADIGLIGMPNAGKSTLLSKIAKVNVTIAPYPFTTLKPNLGMLECDDFSKLIIADIPGLIKGAHKNKGLGISFLKHIERTKLLIYVIDISGQEGRDPKEDFIHLKEELFHFNPKILEKPYWIVLNKIDLPHKKNLEEFLEFFKKEKDLIFPLSASSEKGLSHLIKQLSRQLKVLG